MGFEYEGTDDEDEDVFGAGARATGFTGSRGAMTDEGVGELVEGRFAAAAEEDDDEEEEPEE